MASNPYDPPQEKPEPQATSAWRYLYDPLIDRWMLKVLIAIALLGTLLSTLSTACRTQ